MLDMNEVMTLFFDLIGFVAMLFYIRNKTLTQYPFLIAAYSFILLSNAFTVIEGVWQYHVSNLLEHLCYLAAAICVLVATVYHTPPDEPWNPQSR